MPSLNWYVRRLRAMPLEEIASVRLYRAARDRLFPTPKSPQTPPPLEVPVVSESRRQAFKARFPQEVERIVHLADATLGGQAEIFGRPVSVRHPVAWDADPFSNETWPQVPAHKLNYRDLAGGDPKFVWEINRHQFLLPLAQAYAVTGNNEYAAALTQYIVHWIQTCPPGVGVNWTSGIELALRQLCWVTCLQLSGDAPAWTPEIRAVVATSLATQTQKIRDSLSLYSSANNHLIAELMALVVVGTALKNAEWTRTGARLLWEQAPNQFRADGVCVEQAPSYQSHTTEMYLIAARALQASGGVVPRQVRELLQKSIVFLQFMSSDRGAYYNFGDNDSGHILPVCSSYSEHKSLSNQLARLTKDPEFLHGDAANDSRTFWWHEEDAPAASGNVTVPRAFSEGGYYELRESLAGKDVRLIFDCGPMGMAPLNGHGHADALSFVLDIEGCPIFVDPGTYTYFGELRWRDYFRGTAAHNTVRVDAVNQSKFGGRFLALEPAVAQCLEFGKYHVVGEHNGYERLVDGVTHRREIRSDAAQACIRIRDTMTARDVHRYELLFHCAPGVDVIPLSEHRFELTVENHVVELVFPDTMSVRSHVGDDSGPWGFCSSMYGEKVPISTLRATRLVMGPVAWESQIIIKSEPPAPSSHS